MNRSGSIGWKIRPFALRLLMGMVVALQLLTNCATTDSYEPAPRVPLGVVVEGPVDRYLVEVSYITQNDIGVPTDYRDILSWIAAQGLGHHWMGAYGDVRRPLSDFARMVGCEWVSLA